MSDRRDDPMRLWIGKWTPERPRAPVRPPRPLPAEQNDEKRPATDDDRRAITE